jgi:hypothetical protein
MSPSPCAPDPGTPAPSPAPHPPGTGRSGQQHWFGAPLAAPHHATPAGRKAIANQVRATLGTSDSSCRITRTHPAHHAESTVPSAALGDGKPARNSSTTPSSPDGWQQFCDVPAWLSPDSSRGVIRSAARAGSGRTRAARCSVVSEPDFAAADASAPMSTSSPGPPGRHDTTIRQGRGEVAQAWCPPLGQSSSIAACGKATPCGPSHSRRIAESGLGANQHARVCLRSDVAPGP